MGPAGMHSFGHAAYFGLGAYGAALLVRALRPADGAGARRSRRWSPALGALRLRLVRVRLSGVYLAMLTLAFAQIVWSVVFQWDSFTGGSNGLTGVWPSAWLSDKRAYYWLTLVLVGARRAVAAPHAVLAVRLRDARRARFAAARRCDRHRREAHAVGGLRRSPARSPGWPARCIAFSKGSISPEIAERRQVGRRPGDGAARRHADAGRADRRRRHLHLAAGHGGAQHRLLARACSAAIILLLVLLFPQGIAGFAKQLFERRRTRRDCSRARRRRHEPAASHRPRQVLRRREGASTASASTSPPASCWR